MKKNFGTTSNLKPEARKLRTEVIAGLYLGRPIRKLTIYEIAQTFRLGRRAIAGILQKHKQTNKQLYEKPLEHPDTDKDSLLLAQLRDESRNPTDLVWDDDPERRSIDTNIITKEYDKDSLY